MVGALRHRVSGIAAFVLAPPVAAYIATQHRRLMERAVELPPCFRQEFAPYFTPQVLSTVRVFASESLPLPRFPFAAVGRRCGFEAPDPQLIAAITFDNLIAVRESASSSRLMFHELVHVVQYRILGVSEFARRYVAGFLSGGAYERIPLECCAWKLEERFACGGAPFSVEAAVTASLREPGAPLH